MDPVHPAPPHCPYLATAIPVGAAIALVVATTTLLLELTGLIETVETGAVDATLVGEDPPAAD